MASELQHFGDLLADIKSRIQHAQARAILAVNAELVRLYWDIGQLIDQRQKHEGWGAAVIPKLANALKDELPEEKGFSERNIKRMLAFSTANIPIHPQFCRCRWQNYNRSQLCRSLRHFFRTNQF